ncbi:UDP-glucose/GDP-mannose dehydrogenase [Candidatus Magnetoovum chiemensis]|nr:UDP-glucose/GDP-mannose dehydrogenase [Candidatus Magnetoovum chiemensis]
MKEFQYDISIVGGAGHIGLPMGIAFANKGKKVVLYDTNSANIKQISCGIMPFMEKGADEILKQVLDNKTLSLTADKTVISQSRHIIIVIGTPVDSHLNPSFTIFKSLFVELLEFISDDQHIILRSTVYPGTTERIKDFLIKEGKNPHITFCPERIAEGKAMEELETLPQIIGAFNDSSYEDAKKLFNALTDKIIRLEPLEAELTKLFTNVWRYIQFSISNQFYKIALQNDVDFYKIYDALTYEYPRTKGFPKAGFAAGPCLFKDTMQLASFFNNTFFLGHAAMLINEGLPNFIVQRLKSKYNLRNKTAGILGMAFKADIDDSRDSLSDKLRTILTFEAKEVLCTDPYVKDDTLLPVEEVVLKSDIIIVAAPHSSYKALDIDSSAKILVDVWNFFGKGGLF